MLYVIILSAALDLVGPNVPKGVVLLADVLPSFLTKLIAPYFIHVVPYSQRIWCLVTLSTMGMLLIALTPPHHTVATISVRMIGVVLASLSSGAGELSFLGLTHYYGHFSLAAWGSGTGGAGLVGAGAYVLATTTLGLSIRFSLVVFSFLPVIMLVSFLGVLPRQVLDYAQARALELPGGDEAENGDDTRRLLTDDDGNEVIDPSQPEIDSRPHGNPFTLLEKNLIRARKLIVP